MDCASESTAGLRGRGEALHEGVPGGHVGAVARTQVRCGGADVTRRPNRAGPTNKLRQFFADNPDEELTTSDIRLKFDIDIQHADKVARRLCEMGELARTKDGNRNVYRRAA